MKVASSPDLQFLFQRLQNNLGITKSALQKRLERKAHQLSTRTWVALFALAKESRTPYLRELNSLPESGQAVVQSVVGGNSSKILKVPQGSQAHLTKKEKSELSILISALIQDPILKKRCADLLRARASYDRVFREATTILEDRIKRISGIKSMKPAALVSRALNPNPQKAVIVVSDESFEQEGFHGICKGIVLTFRDTTHHELTDKFSREDALKFCGFIDSLLGIIGRAEIHRERL